jgi:hypothetical protein
MTAHYEKVGTRLRDFLKSEGDAPMKLRAGVGQHAAISLAIDERHSGPLFECAQVAADNGVVESEIEGGAANPAEATDSLVGTQCGEGWRRSTWLVWLAHKIAAARFR